MMIPKLLTAQDVSKILDVSYEAALAFIKYSGIDYVKLGRSYRVTEDKLLSFLCQNGPVHIDLKEDIY